jgi:hypothetical protein
MPTRQPVCNFCGLSVDQVGKLIAGPKDYICDICVIQAFGIVCREKRGICFRIGYFLFESILKVGHGFDRLTHGGRIPIARAPQGSSHSPNGSLGLLCKWGSQSICLLEKREESADP